MNIVTWNKAVRELYKSASRASGCLKTKFYACGDMNYKVFTKLDECLVQPILLYGSSIWGLTVQHRAAMIFLGVYKRTSNVAVHEYLGWMSCLSKQRLEVIRFYYKLYNIEQHRILY